MGNDKDTSQIRCRIRAELDLLHRNFPYRDHGLNKLIHRCDASVSLITKYGPVPARTKPQDHKCFNQF